MECHLFVFPLGSYAIRRRRTHECFVRS